MTHVRGTLALAQSGRECVLVRFEGQECPGPVGMGVCVREL